MRSFFGAGDEALAEEAVEHAEDVYDEPEVLDHVRSIVLGPVVPGGMEVEDDAVVHAVVSLAFFQHEHLDSDSNIYKGGYVELTFDQPESPDRAEGPRRSGGTSAGCCNRPS